MIFQEKILLVGIPQVTVFYWNKDGSSVVGGSWYKNQIYSKYNERDAKDTFLNEIKYLIIDDSIVSTSWKEIVNSH